MTDDVAVGGVETSLSGLWEGGRAEGGGGCVREGNASRRTQKLEIMQKS